MIFKQKTGSHVFKIVTVAVVTSSLFFSCSGGGGGNGGGNAPRGFTKPLNESEKQKAYSLAKNHAIVNTTSNELVTNEQKSNKSLQNTISSLIDLKKQNRKSFSNPIKNDQDYKNLMLDINKNCSPNLIDSSNNQRDSKSGKISITFNLVDNGSNACPVNLNTNVSGDFRIDESTDSIASNFSIKAAANFTTKNNSYEVLGGKFEINEDSKSIYAKNEQAKYSLQVSATSNQKSTLDTVSAKGIEFNITEKFDAAIPTPSASNNASDSENMNFAYSNEFTINSTEVKATLKLQANFKGSNLIVTCQLNEQAQTEDECQKWMIAISDINSNVFEQEESSTVNPSEPPQQPNYPEDNQGQTPGENFPEYPDSPEYPDYPELPDFPEQPEFPNQN